MRRLKQFVLAFFLIHATQTSAITGSASWDIDKDGRVDALTDALLLLRHLFDVSGLSLTDGAVSPSSILDHNDILSSLDETMAIADIDGSGHVDALTDALILLRYLFDVSGDPLIDSAVSPSAIRTTHSIIASYIESKMPKLELPTDDINLNQLEIFSKHVSNSDVHIYDRYSGDIELDIFLKNSSDNSLISADNWSFIALNEYEFTVSEINDAESQAYGRRVNVNPPLANEDFSISIVVTVNEKELTRTVRFKPQFSYINDENSPRLSHSHSIYSYLPYYMTVMKLNSGEYVKADLRFMSNINEAELTKEFSGNYTIPTNLDLYYNHNIDRNTYTVLIASHVDCSDSTERTQMSLLFVEIDMASGKIRFVEYIPKNDFFLSKMGCFQIEKFDDYYIALRSIHAEGTAVVEHNEYYQVDVQALKIGLNGTLIDSKIFHTRVADFGIPLYMAKNKLGHSLLNRHFNDLIINDWSSSWRDLNLNYHSKGIYLVIDTENFEYKPPFIIRAPQYDWTNHTQSNTFNIFPYDGWRRHCGFLKTTKCYRRFQGLAYQNLHYPRIYFSLEDDYSIGKLLQWSLSGNDSGQRIIGGRIEGDTHRMTGDYEFFGNINSSVMYKLPGLQEDEFYTFFSQLKIGQISSGINREYWDIDQSTLTPWSNNRIRLLSVGENSNTATLELNENGHLGCTLTPEETESISVQPLDVIEPVEIIRKAVPDDTKFDDIITNEFEIDFKVMPHFKLRAPVLCSQFTVNIDQSHSMINASNILSFISPKLPSAYDIQVTRPPSNGTYNPETNIYRPDEDFFGFDSFELLADDKSGGTQSVKVEVRIY